MSSPVLNVFTQTDLEYLNSLPEVLEAKARLNSQRVVYFPIPLTTSLRATLEERLGLDSILVDSITGEQREQLIKHMGQIFLTDTKCRLIACVDQRAEPLASEGVFPIWHLALENENERMNYGIYVNGGLLVETCSINTLKNKSNLVGI
jgi:hypothetical protein